MIGRAIKVLFWGGKKYVVHDDGYEERVDVRPPLGWMVPGWLYGWLNRHVLWRL